MKWKPETNSLVSYKNKIKFEIERRLVVQDTFITFSAIVLVLHELKVPERQTQNTRTQCMLYCLEARPGGFGPYR